MYKALIYSVLRSVLNVIELNLQSLGYFSGILGLAISEGPLEGAGRLDMLFISFAMVRNVGYSVNNKQHADPAKRTQIRPSLSADTEDCA